MTSEENKQAIDNITERLKSNLIEEKIDALLDAVDCGDEGIKLVALMLNNSVREVRESAFILLTEIDNETTKNAIIYNHLPFSQMQCIHLIDDYSLGSYDNFFSWKKDERKQHDFGTIYHPFFIGIAEYDKSLVCYWDINYNYSFLNSWCLKTSNLKTSFSVNSAHDLGLIEKGKLCVYNYQERLISVKIETQKYHSLATPTNKYCFSSIVICPYKPIIMTSACNGHEGEFYVWNLETNSLYFNYKFDKLSFPFNSNIETRVKKNPFEFSLNQSSRFIFTPDSKFVVVCYVNIYVRPCHIVIQLWEIETGTLIQEIDNLPLLAVHSLAINPEGKIIAGGIREDNVCVWELQSDKIIKSFPFFSPTLLTADGRIFIYCNDGYDIVVWDLVNNRELVKLKGHTAPIGYIAMSSDREFIASYSTDTSIRVWAIPE